MCVLGRGGGVSAQFLVWEFALRVIFLKIFYQWSYIYLKHLIVKHVFVLVIFEGKHYKKWTMWDLFMSHLFGQGGGLNISTLLLECFFFLLSLSWMNEWVLLGVALPDFPWKHCTPSLSLKSSMWETSGSVKLEFPPRPFTHLLVNFVMESGFMNRTISCFCFLRHGSPSEIVLCQLYPQSPAFLVLPTMHTCLLCPLVS